jgi:hypothetical protein
MTLQDKLKDFSHLDQVKFALFCAKQVAHLNSDTRVKAALSAAEAWVEDPSEDNRLKCKEAADAAAWVADAAADADAAAADTAAWAAYWTTDANSELTEEGLFQSWLMSLVIDS